MRFSGRPTAARRSVRFFQGGIVVMRNARSWSMIAAICLSFAVVAICASAKADDKSAALFKQKCAVCHGADGKGDTPTGKNLKVRSLADPEVSKRSDDDLAAVIEKGKNKMPGYGKSMKSGEIRALVAYCRSLVK